jgi:hypothetical protein
MRYKNLTFSAITIIFSFFYIQTAHCQKNFIPGSIITLSGDSIKGFIDYRNWQNNPNIISFRESDLNLPIDYRPNTLSGFIVN